MRYGNIRGVRVFIGNPNTRIKNKNNKILQFLRELKNSDEKIASIYLYGSCFRLYSILKVIYPNANALYSDQDGHWITEIDGNHYDINGKIANSYVKEKQYEKKDKITEISAYIHTKSNNLATQYNKYDEI